MSDITISINGKQCKAKEGEFILNIARREDIFIPAICYLTGCSPTLACRLCIVDADNKRVYACNAKAKDGMQITTDSEEIANERKAIMQVYNVNHPLQCGVCDQSGECELQNYTLYEKVNEQKFAIADTKRPIRDWGVLKYDAALCIVCEKCVTVCKDSIGDSVLKTVPRGGEPLNKELKASMPKDSYAMWNKLQKSIIGTINEDNSLECQDCGECIAVCPVGALVSTDFQYRANVWELKKIPAANPHSSDCSLIYYEVKNDSIYRVTNEPHYSPISGAVRFGYDFENRVKEKDRQSFEKAVDFIKNRADTIKFNSYITNEEALILQKLKEKYNLKLINKDALAYQKFLKNFSKTSGKSLYSGSLKTIRESNFIISVGTHLRYDNPVTGYAMNNALSMNKGAGIYFHPLIDTVVEKFSKNILTISPDIGSEEHILAFILNYFIKEGVDIKLPEFDRSIIGLPEDFEEKMTKMLAKKDRFSLIVGEDLYTHERSENIAKLVGLIEKYTDFSVVIIPSQTNTLGVSLICDLDEKEGKSVVGYNEKGDFTLSALGDGDLDIPALNQQEGTFTNIDKRVVPTNAALSYNGYILNDIANELGLKTKYTIDYTPQLPKNRGFEPLEFDLLPNFFDNGANEIRGYLLKQKSVKSTDEIDFVKKPKKIDPKDAIYRSNPINQFNFFTNKAHQLKEDGALYVSNEFLQSYDLKDGDLVSIENVIELKVKLDKQLGGKIAYLPTFDAKIDTDKIFQTGYRFAKININKGVKNG